MTSRKHIRYSLLFDEGLPRKESFPMLHNLHTIKHINHDLKKSGAKDTDVYMIAQYLGYMVVVFNTKDFKPLITEGKPSVISLSTGLTNKQIDNKLCSLLKKLKPGQTKGYLISISNEGVEIKSKR